MRKSNYFTIGLWAIVLILADVGLDFILDDSSLETKIWLAITISMIFLVIIFQKNINTSSKN